MVVKEQIAAMRAAALTAIGAAPDLATLGDLRVRYLGKKGELTAILRGMGALSAAERPVIGQLANTAREELEAVLAEREAAMQRSALAVRLQAEAIDITLPGTPLPRGYLHILNQVRTRIEEIFIGMGYDIFEGPEVELDYYNFEALNIPKGHPARDAQDSLFLSDEVLLHTHTSNNQIRYMRMVHPQLPVRVICPGRVFRRDAEDATHSSMFHQVEGLVVDKGITLGDLKGTLLEMARGLLGPDAGVRLRPSFFPFTEPSAEMDISCPFCRQQGCRICKQTGWIEIGGSGMVHPVVLRNGGYDPEVVSGFAFGYGIERMAMLVYQIDDLRLFFQNDLRFLRQF